MIFIPKNRQKRNQLFMALGATVIVVVGLIFGLIRPQYDKLSNIKKQAQDTQEHYKSVENLIHQSNAASTELASLTNAISSAESDMATGDIYAWTVDTMRHFKVSYKVEVPEVGQPGMSEVDIIPNFPYKQLKFTIRGTGYYHDIGRFIADLENKFPHMRVLNIDMSPAGADGERLSFSMDVVALVKNAS
jgi:Tfp pilus assembly protein PilO